jgi:electron transfer flavoprotein beta subunit
VKVTVCIKRVPSTATRLKIAADGRSIDETGVEFVLNPYDEFAVEEALRIAEKSGGEVTLVTFGPEAASKELRNGLAMGAHQAVQIAADASVRDPLATAKVLAAAIGPLAPELVLFGRQAVDADDAQVGLMVATLLGMPAVPDVVKLEVGAGSVRARREVEGAIETYELPLPCMKGIMAAKKKTITAQAPAAAAGTLVIEQLALPPERSGGRILGEGAAAVPALIKALRDEVHAL